MPVTQLDLPLSDHLKQSGQQQVLEHQSEGWISRAKSAVATASTMYHAFTMDDVRMVAAHQDMGKPTHRNAWGAIMSACAREGWIRRTGQYRKSIIPSNRGRMVALWEAAK